MRAPQAVPGALNIASLSGDETVQMVGGPRDAQAQARQVGASPYKIEDVAGTTYGFVLADAAGKYKNFTNAAGCTATVPTNATVAFPIGAQITLEQNGAGAVTIAAAGGVTVNGGTHTGAQYAVAVLIKKAANVWTLAGNVA